MTAHRIVIPAINADVLLNCLRVMSLNTRQRTMVVDNTDDGSISRMLIEDPGPAPARIVTPNRNLGVAASWNLGCRWGFSEGAQFVTLCSASMRFHDGGDGLCDTADFAAEHAQWAYGFESLNGWHLFTIGKATWDAVGEFDEQFWPAYFEDNDYIWRMRCAGILPPAGPHSPARKIPWLPWLKYGCIGDGVALRSGVVSIDLAELETRYVEKWGGKPGEEQVAA